MRRANHARPSFPGPLLGNGLALLPSTAILSLNEILGGFCRSAGVPGVRCAYIVIPDELRGDLGGKTTPVHNLWNRRHTTKFNDVSYPVQRAAEAVSSEQGKREVLECIDYYVANAGIIREGLAKLGLKVFGGVNAPYVGVKTPAGVDSWRFFDRLLDRAKVVGTPGAGFGACGEGYLRLSVFGKRRTSKRRSRGFAARCSRPSPH